MKIIVLISQDFEERTYPPQKWVSTKIVGMDYDASVSKGFFMLFNYIQGHNDTSK